MKKSINFFAATALLVAASTGFAQQVEPKLNAENENSLAENYMHLGENLPKSKQDELFAAITTIGKDMFEADKELVEEGEELELRYREAKKEYVNFKLSYKDLRQGIQNALAKRLDGKNADELIAEAERIKKERNEYGHEHFDKVQKKRAQEEINAAFQEQYNNARKKFETYADSFSKINKAMPSHKNDEFNRAIVKFSDDHKKHNESLEYYEASRKMTDEFIRFAKDIADDQQLDDKTADEIIATITRLNKEGLGE